MMAATVDCFLAVALKALNQVQRDSADAFGMNICSWVNDGLWFNMLLHCCCNRSQPVGKHHAT